MYTTGDVQRLAIQPATRLQQPMRTHTPAATARAIAFDVRPTAYAVEILMLLSALSVFAVLDLARAWF
jgi:hypothetical protein